MVQLLLARLLGGLALTEAALAEAGDTRMLSWGERMGGGCTSPAPPRQVTLHRPRPQEPEIQSLLQFCTGILSIIGSVLQADRFESSEYMKPSLLTETEI